jgi:hypothetical protein
MDAGLEYGDEKRVLEGYHPYPQQIVAHYNVEPRTEVGPGYRTGS